MEDLDPVFLAEDPDVRENPIQLFLQVAAALAFALQVEPVTPLQLLAAIALVLLGPEGAGGRLPGAGRAGEGGRGALSVQHRGSRVRRDDVDLGENRHERRQDAAALHLAVIVRVDREDRDFIAQLLERREIDEVGSDDGLRIGIPQARRFERCRESQLLRGGPGLLEPEQEPAILRLGFRNAHQRENRHVRSALPAALLEALVDRLRDHPHLGVVGWEEVHLRRLLEIGDVALLRVLNARAAEA